MGLDYGSRDGQAKARTLRPRRGIGAHETVEDALAHGFWDPGPVVGDLNDGRRAVDRDRGPDLTRLARVGDRVLGQAQQQAAQAFGVTAYGRRDRLRVEPALRIG